MKFLSKALLLTCAMMLISCSSSTQLRTFDDFPWNQEPVFPAVSVNFKSVKIEGLETHWAKEGFVSRLMDSNFFKDVSEGDEDVRHQVVVELHCQPIDDGVTQRVKAVTAMLSFGTAPVAFIDECVSSIRIRDEGEEIHKTDLTYRLTVATRAKKIEESDDVFYLKAEDYLSPPAEKMMNALIKRSPFESGEAE